MQTAFVIIVAAGAGSRMKENIPKQFLLLDNKPILMHTIEKFCHCSFNPEIILVLSEEMKEYWEGLCKKYKFNRSHSVVFGGKSRFQSVRNGIDYITNKYEINVNAKISVHDGARPLVSRRLIEELYHVCNAEVKAVVPATKSINSVRIGSEINNKPYDRETVWQIQTPQVFDARLLIEAYKQQESTEFSDDASVVEKMSNTIFLHQGDQWNIKITYKEDLAIAHSLIKSI